MLELSRLQLHMLDTPDTFDTLDPGLQTFEQKLEVTLRDITNNLTMEKRGGLQVNWKTLPQTVLFCLRQSNRLDDDISYTEKLAFAREAERLIWIALYRIDVRLHFLFEHSQHEIRGKIDRNIKNGGFASLTFEQLDAIKEERASIENEITELKQLHDKLIRIAKELGLRVFDEDTFRYAWHRVLDIPKEPFIATPMF